MLGVNWEFGQKQISGWKSFYLLWPVPDSETIVGGHQYSFAEPSILTTVPTTMGDLIIHVAYIPSIGWPNGMGQLVVALLKMKPALYQDLLPHMQTFLQKCIYHHETKQASKFLSDPSSNCFTIAVRKINCFMQQFIFLLSYLYLILHKFWHAIFIWNNNLFKMTESHKIPLTSENFSLNSWGNLLKRLVHLPYTEGKMQQL